MEMVVRKSVPSLRVAVVAVTATMGWVGAAGAIESGGMFLHSVNPKGRTVTKEQVERYVDRRFDILAGTNSQSVSKLKLGGRMSSKEFDDANTKPLADPTLLSRDAFKAYADKLFDEANAADPQGKHTDGSLDADELKTPAGKNLIRLLE